MTDLLTADENTLIEIYRSISLDDKRMALVLLSQMKTPRAGNISVFKSYIGDNNNIAVNGTIYVSKREEMNDNGK